MILKPGFGIDKLLFGMRQKDVIALYGEPSRRYEDDDDNVVFSYNDLKLRLTFYAEEDFRLGYLISAHPDTAIGDVKPIGVPAEKALATFKEAGFAKWTNESFDTYENYVNEEQWIILQSEFGQVIKLESGAFIDEKSDAFVWRVK